MAFSDWLTLPRKQKSILGLSVKGRTEPNQTEPAEITEPAQPNLRKLTDNYEYRYRVLAPFTDSHLGVINIIIINHYYYYY